MWQVPSLNQISNMENDRAQVSHPTFPCRHFPYVKFLFGITEILSLERKHRKAEISSMATRLAQVTEILLTPCFSSCLYWARKKWKESNSNSLINPISSLIKTGKTLKCREGKQAFGVFALTIFPLPEGSKITVKLSSSINILKATFFQKPKLTVQEFDKRSPKSRRWSLSFVTNTICSWVACEARWAVINNWLSTFLRNLSQAVTGGEWGGSDRHRWDKLWQKYPQAHTGANNPWGGAGPLHNQQTLMSKALRVQQSTNQNLFTLLKNVTTPVMSYFPLFCWVILFHGYLNIFSNYAFLPCSLWLPPFFKHKQMDFQMHVSNLLRFVYLWACVYLLPLMIPKPFLAKCMYVCARECGGGVGLGTASYIRGKL